MTADTAALRRRVQERLIAEPSALEAPSRFERRIRVREAVARILSEEGVSLPPQQIASLVHEIADVVVGLGPLEPLLRDPDVDEIMVVAHDKVYVERRGAVERAPVTLANEAAVRHMIERIVAPLGLRVDESMPWVDARLPDGSRVHAIIPPLALTGPALTVRKFSRAALTANDLIAAGAWTGECVALLRDRVVERDNIIISGGTGAGKTTMLNILSSFVPGEERVVTIEDAAELRLAQDHVVSLETRPPNLEGRGNVTLRDLVRNALRMRPDRIIVGEVRGGEAFDMLQAMNTGHDGSMSTAHANSADDLLRRLEAMVLMSGAALPVGAVRRQIAAGLDLIVHVERRGKKRRVAEVRRIDEIDETLTTSLVWSADD